ncbi:hypothetical protein ALI144C_50940 [Actinosynnema sp. ALI-1.44]|uniref:hypothetical protein n=1 Tax=Actinosynnema sp. ALI-1.44 TaxID=1933779 RepID=UPI00097C4709|nr:hypothetical protein [Actinosynnema sp. ALI-1.44]ONI70906.1 hypothetical protein ALI144C_50940 [Actinosynnema sp. ALI-1.44]
MATAHGSLWKEVHTMGRETPMNHEAAERISAAAERDPDSPAAQSGFDDRAQQAADRNDDAD